MDNINKVNSIFIKDWGNMQSINLYKIEPEDEEIYLDFWIMEWVSHNVIQEIKERIKMAWNILIKGNYKYQEIILTNDNAYELRKWLDAVIKY